MIHISKNSLIIMTANKMSSAISTRVYKERRAKLDWRMARHSQFHRALFQICPASRSYDIICFPKVAQFRMERLLRVK